MTHPMILAALSLLVLSACAIQPTPIRHPPVPPIPAEAVPPAPRASVPLIWQPGHYDWTGSDYVWIAGVWVPREGHGTLWQDGYWRSTGAASVWVPGHWL
ncbi:MAG: YXWGXW repeat-containing protein [Gemmatimonadaceae bacterium]|nr:YXWGXW repeat-containing protein [Acetobacteraceae bacterium]